MYGLNKML